MDATEQLDFQEIEEGKKKARKRLIRDVSVLFAVMLSIEYLTAFYTMYTMGWLRDDRWKVFITLNILATIPFSIVMTVFCLKWARPAIEFDRTVYLKETPTIEQAEGYVRCIFDWARNGALLLIFLYSINLIVISFILWKYFKFTPTDLFFMSALKFMGAVSMSLIFYYAVKILIQIGGSMALAVEMLFAAGKYELSHFRLGITYKIFLLIFAIVTYLLTSAVLLGYTQAENIQKNQMKTDLEYWVKEIPAKLFAAGPDAQQNIHASLLGNKLSARAHLVIWGRNGEVTGGDASDIDGEEKMRIISSVSGGEIIDYNNHKIIVYMPYLKDGYFAATIGFWGETGKLFKETKFAVLILFVVTIFLSIVGTFLLVSDVNMPLKEILSFLKAIAGGDSGKRLRAYSEDEMGDFARELARTTALLESKTDHANDLLNKMMEASGAIKENSSGAHAAAEEQAAGVNEQASAVSEILNTSEEIVVSARQIAGSAFQVQQAAEKNLLSCRAGGKKAENAIEGFRSLANYVGDLADRIVLLGGDVKKITEVIVIIEEIASQINLLAFNAQLEAVGAGERGKRFGVVAGEVKRLASNTIAAAQKIRELIDSTLKASAGAVELAEKGQGIVREGTELADFIGKTLHEIEMQAGLTESAASQISLLTRQQQTSSEQMAESLSNVNSVTEQIKTNTGNVLDAMDKLLETADRLKVDF